MPLYIIGLGLSDEKDITLKGLEAIKKCDLIYFEKYTSLFPTPIDKLEQYYGKKIIIADREMVESDNNEIIKNAKTKNVALLVAGDPLSATTHIDLFLRAKKEGIDCEIIHNASIITAIGITGLQLYKFGKITSIPLKNENIEAPYNILGINKKNEMHTLFILDIDIENNNFLTIKEAIQYLLGIETKNKQKVFSEKAFCVGCARIGSESQIIKYGEINKIKKIDFGRPPYCLIVPAKLHFMEEEALGMYKV